MPRKTRSIKIQVSGVVHGDMDLSKIMEHMLNTVILSDSRCILTQMDTNLDTRILEDNCED